MDDLWYVLGYFLMILGGLVGHVIERREKRN